jgi:tight adherence protein C
MTDPRALILAVNIALTALVLTAAVAANLPAGATLAIAYGLAALLVALAIGLSLLDRRIRLQRVKSAVNKGPARSVGGRGGRGWRESVLSFMHLVTRKMTIMKDRQIKELRVLLVSAGYRSRDAIVVFSFFKLMAPLVALVGAGLWVFGAGSLGYGGLIDFAAVALAALVGSKIPDFIVGRRRKGRLESIRKGLPDALDMVVICAEAGLASDAALKRVVAEIGRRSSALGDELQQTVLELTFMPERRMALENFAERAPIPSVQAFANTLIQAERYGTPLARAFKVLSSEQRAERMMRAEEKAGRLPATMTVPMMIFILPALFIVLIGPAALDIMDNFVGMEP